MRPPTEQESHHLIVQILADLMELEPGEIAWKAASHGRKFDMVVTLPDISFLVNYKNSASSGSLTAAVEQIRNYADLGTPLVVVPYMGNVGQKVCENQGISWLDLSGNARIKIPGHKIWIEGRPNRFTGPGRPPNLFAPKSSRIARQLLLKPETWQSQVGLGRKTGLDGGYVSKIVRRLRDENLILQSDQGIRPRDPSLMLDEWHNVYDFKRHEILEGHVNARSGDALISQIAGELKREEMDYSVTGLGAAWLLTRFANFRLGTIYVSSPPPESFLEAIGFWQEPRGANLRFVVPNDEGVFHGSEELEGIRCVCPVQAYLDLKDQPERASDAAADLRIKFLKWERNGS